MEASMNLEIMFYVLQTISALMLFIISKKFYLLSKSNLKIKNLSDGLFDATLGGGLIFSFEMIGQSIRLSYLETHVLCSCIAICSFYRLLKAVA